MTDAKPIFLVICMDQISALSLGCNGNQVVQTPNMVRLAADSKISRSIEKMNSMSSKKQESFRY